ncbi:acetate--CoA ligase family protein [Pararhizobium haloflavum]|uniref:acetate--CoA ligase family protein n=1 Tax=Pararhizobium haloflavum TaxID=2037914 RepID=UPI000C1A8035|nr:acetate--CoA ligase family protein [Pararhizobium haloflavum]
MTTDLSRLVRPQSVAVVGASSDFRKVSGRPIKHLIDKGYQGRIFPINPKAERIGDIPALASIADLPEGVDLAIVVLPADAVAGAIRALGRRKVAAAVVFASGFGEVGPEGAAMEAELAGVARSAGVRLLGPNCLGLFNAFERMIGTFSQYVDGEVPAGPVAFVSQSGAFGTAISALARARDLGLGYFVNTGNEADITFVDAMGEVLADERIRVGAGYIEGLKDGPGLVRLAEKAMDLGKPLVLTKVGRTGAGAKAAASHTGSLAGEDIVFDGVLSQNGVLRARNEEHMLDLVEILANCALPAGGGVGIATQSGGAGVLMADRAEELGLTVAELSDATRAKIAATIPGFGATGNPVDVTGQFVADPAVLSDSVVHMLADPAVDVGIVWLQLMGGHVDTLVSIFEDIKARVEKPFVVAWVAAPEAALRALRARGIAVLRGAEPAVDAVAGLVRFAAARRQHMDDKHDVPSGAPGHSRLTQDGIVPTVMATELLQSAGVSIVPARAARSVEEAVAAAAELGYPVAMKVESPDILHKTEIGGVRLGLADEAGVRRAFGELDAAARHHRPDARLDGVVLQPMRTGAVEAVIGLKNDPVFGTVVMLGLGGIFIEVLKDVVFARCPVTPSQANAMIGGLKGAAMFGAVRGRAPVDTKALAEMVVAVSRFGAEYDGAISELDLNPVMLSASGAAAVDVVLIGEGASATNLARSA